MIGEAVSTLHKHYGWKAFIEEVEATYLEQQEEGMISLEVVLDSYAEMCYEDGETMLAIAWLQIEKYGEPTHYVGERCLEFIEEEVNLHNVNNEVKQAHLRFADEIKILRGEI